MSPVAEQTEVIEGVVPCLSALVVRLGAGVEPLALPMLAHFVADLQATCAHGAGLHPESLRAIGILASQLGCRFAEPVLSAPAL